MGRLAFVTGPMQMQTEETIRTAWLSSSTPERKLQTRVADEAGQIFTTLIASSMLVDKPKFQQLSFALHHVSGFAADEDEVTHYFFLGSSHDVKAHGSPNDRSGIRRARRRIAVAHGGSRCLTRVGSTGSELPLRIHG